MKVFISSVRRGLEVERDSLPGLILGLGHEPYRFEDFGAQPVPSREACLRGVQASDVYLLLLGPHYGHVFPDTGQSPTHEEWVAATSAGLPRLVFRKTGVPFEPEQENFARLVGAYPSGVFYAEFADLGELLARVGKVLRELASAPTSLTYESLTDPATVRWRSDWEPIHSSTLQYESWIEMHAVPVPTGGASIPARVLRTLSDDLIGRLRAANAIPPAVGVTPALTASGARVDIPRAEHRGWMEVHDGALSGVRVDASGQVSLWWSLPGDQMGPILDRSHLVTTLTEGLRLLGTMRLVEAPRYAIAVGLGGSLMSLAEGRLTGVSRTSVSTKMRERDIRVAPDESVSSAAFDRGAPEVAGTLADGLLAEFRADR